MNRASGAHRTASKARNSWKEINLFGEERKKMNDETYMDLQYQSVSRTRTDVEDKAQKALKVYVL